MTLLAALLGLPLFALRSCRALPREGDDTTYVPPEASVEWTGFAGAYTAGGTSGGVEELSFLDIPVVMTQRVLHDSFEGSLQAALSPDGTSYTVMTPCYRGLRRYQRFQVYDLEGRLLWEHVFPDRSYRTCQTWYLAGGRYIGATACRYNDDGELHLLDAGGRFILARDIDGWTSPVMSADGSWLALFNQTRRVLTVLGPPDFEPAWSLRVASGAAGFFLGDGPRFLLREPGLARLFDGAGQVVWTVEIKGGGRWAAALSPDGELLAVTSEDPDSSVYLYSTADGTLLWSHSLVVGGNKEAVFSPDGESLVVYDVGSHSAIYMFDTATGDIVWRSYLRGRVEPDEDAALGGDRGSPVLTIEHLEFTPSGEYLVADVSETVLQDRVYTFSRYLLLLNRAGKAVWVAPLGSQVDVDVSARAGLVLITTNHPYDAYSRVTNHLTVVSFTAEPSGH